MTSPDIHTFSVSPTDVGTLFNEDPTGVFTNWIIEGRTYAGSTYRVMLIGPTITIIREGRPIKVRAVQYIRTLDGHPPQKTAEKYINFSGPEVPGFRFFAFEEEKNIQHTRAYAPMSSDLLPDMKLSLVVFPEDE